VGKKPTYLAIKPKYRPKNLQKSTQFFEKLKKPTLQNLKVGRNYVNLKRFTDEFYKKKSPC
jgi:hypothetical protein